MLLEVGVALSFEAEVHPHGDQKLDGEVGDLLALAAEDRKHHRDYAQPNHQHSRLFGKRDTLQNAQDWLAASTLLSLYVENTHQILDQLGGTCQILQSQHISGDNFHKLEIEAKC